eukprot:3861351-Pyramimonas_sp.AAC.1
MIRLREAGPPSCTAMGLAAVDHPHRGPALSSYDSHDWLSLRMQLGRGGEGDGQSSCAMCVLAWTSSALLAEA